jgi:hypothetical protein
MNAPDLMFVTLFGIETLVRLVQYANAELPMEEMWSEMVTLVRLVQFENAS